MSSEPIDESVNVMDDNREAAMKVGTHTVRGPVAVIEAMMVMVNQHLQSRVGYGWLSIGGEGTDRDSPTSVLVSRSTPISIAWPAGFEPFENPNELVDDIRKDPVADLPDDE